MPSIPRLRRPARLSSPRRLGGKTLVASFLILLGFILGLWWIRLPQTGYTADVGTGYETYLRPASVPAEAERQALVGEIVMQDYLEDTSSAQPYTGVLTFARVTPLLRSVQTWYDGLDPADPSND